MSRDTQCRRLVEWSWDTQRRRLVERSWDTQCRRLSALRHSVQEVEWSWDTPSHSHRLAGCGVVGVGKRPNHCAPITARVASPPAKQKSVCMPCPRPQGARGGSACIRKALAQGRHLDKEGTRTRKALEQGRHLHKEDACIQSTREQCLHKEHDGAGGEASFGTCPLGCHAAPAVLVCARLFSFGTCPCCARVRALVFFWRALVFFWHVPPRLPCCPCCTRVRKPWALQPSSLPPKSKDHAPVLLSRRWRARSSPPNSTARVMCTHA